MWKIVQQACLHDEYRANVVLEKHRMRTAKGCINHIIDENGYHYYVPNYCINDPYFEKDLNNNNEHNEKELVLFLYEFTQNVTLKLKVPSQFTGAELKDAFRKEIEDDPREFKLWLFFSGCEIKDEHFLYQHK